MVSTPEHLLSRRSMCKRSHHQRSFLFLFQFSSCFIHYLSWHYERNSSFGRLWMIKGHQMKTKRSLHVYYRLLPERTAGEIHTFLLSQCFGGFFVLMHMSSCSQLKRKRYLVLNSGGITLSHKLQRRGPVCIYLWRQAMTVCDLAHDTLNKRFSHSQSTASNSIHCLSMIFSGLITPNHVWFEHVSKLKVQQQGMRWMRKWLARCHALTLVGSKAPHSQWGWGSELEG